MAGRIWRSVATSMPSTARASTMATSSGIVKAMAMVLNEAPLLSGSRRRAYLAAGLSPEGAAGAGAADL